LGRIPIERAVARGGDEGHPVSLGGTGNAAEEFRRIARAIIASTPSTAEMSGCSARADDAQPLTLTRRG